MDEQLERFVTAQDEGGAYRTALAELRAGQKRSHWMWFVFPQVAGLGHSAMARRYALASLAEARAYLAHPVLSARLLDCVRAVLAVPGRSASDVLGGIDAMKLRSSLTLFAAADPEQPLFGEALARFFDGRPDEQTLVRLNGA